MLEVYKEDQANLEEVDSAPGVIYSGQDNSITNSFNLPVRDLILLGQIQK
jgi:hypothetical protein